MSMKKKTTQRIKVGSFVETTPFFKGDDPFQGVVINRFKNWMFVKGFGTIYCEDIDSIHIVEKPKDFRICEKRNPKIKLGDIVSSTNSDNALVLKIVEDQWCIVRDTETKEIFPEPLDSLEFFQPL